ncbi:WD40-repeat-containing domain protein [Chiua virens]|nr:WD40-repeat-containing domain protein [Chiua virens]
MDGTDEITVLMKPQLSDGGPTSHDAARAGGSLVQDQGKEIECPVMGPQTSSAMTSQQNVRKTIEIDGRDEICSVAFLMEGKHVLSGGNEEKIRRWRLEDGQEIARPIDVGGLANAIAVSSDEKWIVGGSSGGSVLVWSVESHEQVSEMKGHMSAVYAVDISPDGTKIASGSWDGAACIWEQSTGEQLLVRRQRTTVVVVKFSPDGHLLAIATWYCSVCVYNIEDGRLLCEFSIRPGSTFNQCLAWNDDTHISAISRDGIIHYLNVSTGETLSRWLIRTDGEGQWGCIALSKNHSFIAASAESLISFWDATTHTKIGSDIDYNDTVNTMAISENYDIAIGHGKTVTVQNLGGILPSRYVRNHDNVDPGEGMTSLRPQADDEITDLKNLKAMQEPNDQLTVLQGRYEVQSRKLALAQKELETLKSSIKAKDRQIDVLAADVDHWKRSDASKTEELAAVHRELEERRRDSEELIAVREELQVSQSQTIQIQEWYDEQFRYLKSVVEQNQRTPFIVQNFIAQADARAEMNIIETLQQLNSRIDWSSTFIADRIIHNFEPRTTNPTEEQVSIAARVTGSIGQSLVNRLRSNSRTEVVAYLPIAFRAYLIYHLCGIMSSWSMDSGPDRLIRELYSIVRKLESQTISARWRSLTYAALSPTCSSNPSMLITSTMDGLCDIIVTAGCAPSASAAKEMIASKFRGRISFILTTAGQLTKSIMNALSADYRIEAIHPLKVLDGQTMEVDSAGPGKKSRSQFVLCTTQLGLSKEVITQSGVGPNTKNTLTVTNVVKAKVVMG